MFIVIALSIVAIAALVGTIRLVMTDGYRRIPTDPRLIPDRDCPLTR